MSGNTLQMEDLLEYMQDVAPLEFAEEWDNVGLLIDPLRSRPLERILLTIDLTETVVEEAVDMDVQLILSYHPIMFSPVQSFSRKRHSDLVVMKLLRNDLAVYSPHTALDAAQGGVNDWLANGAGNGNISIAKPCERRPECGMGRVIKLEEEVGVGELGNRLQRHLGAREFNLAYAPYGKERVRTVGICAGSGADVLEGIEADVFVTGEMKHHEVMECTRSGTHVILYGHTITERGYLRILRERIEKDFQDVLSVAVSQSDRDPFGRDGQH